MTPTAHLIWALNEAEHHIPSIDQKENMVWCKTLETIILSCIYKMKDNLLVSGIVALGLLAIPIGICFTLILSYGMLHGINYFLINTAYTSISPIDINAFHVLLGAIFIAILFRNDSQTSRSIEKLEESISFRLRRIDEKLEHMAHNLNNLEEISHSISTIESNTNDINYELSCSKSDPLD